MLRYVLGARRDRQGLSTLSLVESYRKHGSIAGVVQEFHCSPKTVRKALKDMGYTLVRGEPVASPNVGITMPVIRCPTCHQITSTNECCGEVIAQAFHQGERDD